MEDSPQIKQNDQKLTTTNYHPEQTLKHEQQQPTESNIPSTTQNSSNDQTNPSITSQDTASSTQSSTIPPNIQELANMFPQIQITILQAVLDARNNDLQACIPDLLEMTDPTYKPSDQESMERTDEQLARQLSLHENQDSIDQSSPPIHQQQEQQNFNLPYQPRIKRNTTKPPVSPSTYQQQQSNQLTNQSDPPNDFQGKDEIQKIADEIGKLAETGKKTVSFWFNKAKAKMQEIQTAANSTPHQSGQEDLEDGYEAIPKPNHSTTKLWSLDNSKSNTSTATITTKDDRITPNLPYGSRYQQNKNTNTNPELQPSKSVGSNSTGFLPVGGPSSSSSGYKVDETISSEKGTMEERASKMNLTGDHPGSSRGINNHELSRNKDEELVHPNLGSTLKVKEDDEESLEYTRNPFEDDD